MIHTTTWISLENMLSEKVSHKDHIFCMIQFLGNVQNRQIVRDESN